MTGYNLLAGMITLLVVVGLVAFVVYTLRTTPIMLPGVLGALAVVLVAVPPLIIAFAG